MPLPRHSVGILSRNLVTRNSSGNTRSQSSQLPEPLWTNPGIKSGITVCKLISTLKKKKKAWGGRINTQTFSQNPCTQGKATTMDLSNYIVSLSVSGKSACCCCVAAGMKSSPVHIGPWPNVCTHNYIGLWSNVCTHNYIGLAQYIMQSTKQILEKEHIVIVTEFLCKSIFTTFQKQKTSFFFKRRLLQY